MKATGIVRRIDELGRVVIPMELRRSLGINDRDSLEIFTDNDGYVIFKKFDPLPEITSQIKTLQEMINENTNYKPEVTKKALGLLSELENLMKSTE